jgi:hypothetical protein
VTATTTARIAAVALAACTACAPTVLWTGRTADRRHRVDIVQGAGAQWVVVDGQRRAAYRGIAAWSVATGDGARVVYAARRGDGWVVVDGRPGPAFDGIGEIAIGPGGRLAYAAERAGRWEVVVDGAAARPPRWTAILARTLAFSRDGAHLVYAAEDAAGARVVIDGAAGPAWSGVGQLAMNDAGTRIAYAARRGRDAFAVIDGAAGPRFDNVTQLTVAPRGARTAYLGHVDGATRVVIDGVAGPAHDGAVRALRISADGAHVAHVAAGSDGGDRILCDGDELAATPPRALVAASLAFVAAPGCAVAYVLDEPDGARVVRAGVPGPRYDEIGALAVSPDGSRLGYAARRGAAWRVVIDGREHDGGHWAESPVWSLDGARWGYLARRGDKAVAVVDGRAFAFDIALDGTLAFSRDGRAWSIVAGDLARQELFFAIHGAIHGAVDGALDGTLDGTRRVPLPTVELTSAAAALSLDRPLLDPTAPNVLGLWSAAEADRARSQ